MKKINDILKVDKNFVNFFSHDGMRGFDINKPPFRLFGLCRADGEKDFKRLPKELAEKSDNNSVRQLYTNTAGIRLRFRTDSKSIIVGLKYSSMTHMDHMPFTGSTCFDLYADGRYVNVFFPGRNVKSHGGSSKDKGYQSGISFPDKRMRDITMNFPLYNNVDDFRLELDEDAHIEECADYTYPVPVVYYGSSITQGGCASHPGNSYQAIISNRLDCDYINLGFSGGCHGEEWLAEYIASLKQSVFVYDYDHNAPTAEELERTHEPFFRRFRELRPDTPVIMVSSADVCFGEKERDRRKDIIYRTYENAVKNGDKNVYFIDGSDIYSDVGRDLCTVDGVHPNDIGFLCMADTIGSKIKEILENRKEVSL